MSEDPQGVDQQSDTLENSDGLAAMAILVVTVALIVFVVFALL